MKCFCPGFGNETNGMSVVAGLMLNDPDWNDRSIVHGAWLAGTWFACLRFGDYLRMPHGAYDPVRLKYHGWKKSLVRSVERFFLRRAQAVIATCAAERDWILAYEPKAKVVQIDLKRYFKLPQTLTPSGHSPLRVLFLGRNHPLKGVDHLQHAAKLVGDAVELKVVSDATGAAKDAVWDWCDCLVLPTLSENFGLVVAEALERGKPVVTTDGAPVWKNQPGVTYLDGYRDAPPEKRVKLLVDALSAMI